MKVNLNQWLFIFRLQIIPALILKNKEVFCNGHVDCPHILFWIVSAKCLKNKKMFRIGRMDSPCVLFRIIHSEALKTWRCSGWYVWICTRQESQCLPYADFFLLSFVAHFWRGEGGQMSHGTCHTCACHWPTQVTGPVGHVTWEGRR